MLLIRTLSVNIFAVIYHLFLCKIWFLSMPLYNWDKAQLSIGLMEIIHDCNILLKIDRCGFNF